MDLGSFLSAYLALSGAHTLNHLSVADQTNAPARLDMESGGERWTRPESELGSAQNKFNFNDTWNKGIISKEGFRPYMPSPDEVDRHGAGFSGQDSVNAILDTPESNMANALYKALYLAGSPKFFGGNTIYKDSDIGGIADNSGMSRDQVKGLLALSTVADFLKGTQFIPREYGSLSFSTLNQGTPGLIWSKRW